MNVDGVIRGYFESPGTDRSYARNNVSVSCGTLYSYRMPIARYLPDRHIFLLRSGLDSPSVTTSRHISTTGSYARRTGAQVMSLSFRLLDKLGVGYNFIQGVQEISHGSHSLHYVSPTLRAWITIMSHVTYGDFELMRTPRTDVPSVLVTRDRPQSYAHLCWSMLPTRYHGAAYDGRVWRIGDVFVIEEPDADDKPRKTAATPVVATTGYDQVALRGGSTGHKNKRLITGRIHGVAISLKPTSTWYRVVPARIRSVTASMYCGDVWTPSTKLLPWPSPIPWKHISTPGA